MEIRVLKYFLTVAQEQSFSKAAKVLNVSQPALSKQIKDLEEEYQITLFNRTTRSLSLTEEGRLFKEQAKQIISLVNRTDSYLKNINKYISGDIYLGCSESEANRIVMKAISKTQQHHPDIRFHIYSGNAQYVEEKLDQGIFDLGIVTDPADLSKYDYLFYNAKLMCEENVGYVLTLKHLYNESNDSPICFKPLNPPLTLRSHLVWKKYKVFPKAIEIFLEILNEEIKKSS